MGVYRKSNRIGYEIFFGSEAKLFPPAQDLITLHRNILLVKDREDGILLFLNVNLKTLLEERETLGEVFRRSEDIPFLFVLEVSLSDFRELEDMDKLGDLFDSVRSEFSVSLSFSSVRLSPRDYSIIKRFSPDYVKMSVKEVRCLPREAIALVVELFEECTSSAVVFTHVESREEFDKLPDNALWLGYYEEKLLRS